MTPPSYAPGCPHCHETSADMREYDLALRRWFCATCGRFFAALVPVHVIEAP